jgi:superfamily II DNA or RNA helicase
MSLQDINIKREYRSLVHEIARDFYIPLLSCAVSYDRALGYFSSSILAQIMAGIAGLRNNGGKIRLVVSPYLSYEDVKAIKTGYKKREEVIALAIERELHEPVNDFEKEHLNMLANLIADGVLDIRVAFTERNDKMGMYHEKMGLISDNDGNTVAFSGSMNETTSGLELNYEAIDVYCSWHSKDEEARVYDKQRAFDAIWNDKERGIRTIEFPKLKQDIINKYRKSTPNWDAPAFLPPEPVGEVGVKKGEYYPKRPQWFRPRRYQIEAIDKWAKAGYRGIFDMATGTGKTLTALEAIVTLSERVKNRLAVIVVVPYQHLVEQWVEDIEKFNINPIIGYSASQQRDWGRRLVNAVRDQKIGATGRDFFLFICTNATFATAKVQSQIEKIKCDVLLVVDEAHNAGASRFLELLHDTYTYRLALSATIDRHNDAEGTKRLFDFFGDKCIEYTLEEAIANGTLTKYYYYPVLTYLSHEEHEEYLQLTQEISKCMIVGDDGKRMLSERGKRLALKRSRVIAGAQDKLSTLEKVIQPYKDQKHILVYCGSANVFDESKEASEIEERDIRQVVAVSKLLGNKMNMKVARFTSEEDIKTRAALKKDFAEGTNLQALIAIKCLDEGVNIPAIKVAFIMASTTNPKEYIQRRGRVLRTFKDPTTGKEKEYAEIFDFITLPRPLNNVPYLTADQQQMDLPLIKRELARAEDFANLALNMPDAKKILDEIKEAYGINNYLLTSEEEYL